MFKNQNHPDYDFMLPAVQAVRDAIMGSHFVKAKGFEYLPHPSEIDSSSADAKARYKVYLFGAEFDEFPKQTEKSLLGKLKVNNAEIELPAKLEYLINDIDGDGSSLVGAIENTAKNILAAKFHVLIADFKGGISSELSLEQSKRINPRAVVKQYNRESVINWSFGIVNGVNQLNYLMLCENVLKFDRETVTYKKYESLLILALDESGDYYQQKIIKSADGISETGELNYQTINGQRLKWLPVEIVSDEELESGKLPIDLGYLAPICDAAYYRYRQSAEYKETMRKIAPTVNTSGWDSMKWETFQEINGGRDYIITGSGGTNNLPEDVTMQVISSAAELGGFERYFEDNERKVRALGGSFKTSNEAQQTATKSLIDNSEQTARLITLADALESGFKRVLLYCGMFEGLWSDDDIEKNIDEIVLSLNKDFAQSKLNEQQVTALINLRMSGIYPDDEIIKLLVQGGWSVSSAEDLINRADGAQLQLEAVPDE